MLMVDLVDERLRLFDAIPQGPEVPPMAIQAILMLVQLAVEILVPLVVGIDQGSDIVLQFLELPLDAISLREKC